MVPGSTDGKNNWVESSSLARSIEEAMVSAGILSLSKESHAVAKDRRKSFVAIATGLINYVQQNIEIDFSQGQLRGATDVSQAVPSTAVTLTGAVK